MKQTISNTAFFRERLHAPLRSQYAWGAVGTDGVYLRAWAGDIVTDADGSQWAWIDYVDMPERTPSWGVNAWERRTHADMIASGAPGYLLIHDRDETCRRYDPSQLVMIGREFRDITATNRREFRVTGWKGL